MENFSLCPNARPNQPQTSFPCHNIKSSKLFSAHFVLFCWVVVVLGVAASTSHPQSVVNTPLIPKPTSKHHPHTCCSMKKTTSPSCGHGWQQRADAAAESILVHPIGPTDIDDGRQQKKGPTSSPAWVSVHLFLLTVLGGTFRRVDRTKSAEERTWEKVSDEDICSSCSRRSFRHCRRYPPRLVDGTPTTNGSHGSTNRNLTVIWMAMTIR